VCVCGEGWWWWGGGRDRGGLCKHARWRLADCIRDTCGGEGFARGQVSRSGRRPPRPQQTARPWTAPTCGCARQRPHSCHQRQTGTHNALGQAGRRVGDGGQGRAKAGPDWRRSSGTASTGRCSSIVASAAAAVDSPVHTARGTHPRPPSKNIANQRMKGSGRGHHGTQRNGARSSRQRQKNVCRLLGRGMVGGWLT
jgi:hypothetical protein